MHSIRARLATSSAKGKTATKHTVVLVVFAATKRTYFTVHHTHTATTTASGAGSITVVCGPRKGAARLA